MLAGVVMVLFGRHLWHHWKEYGLYMTERTLANVTEPITVHESQCTECSASKNEERRWARKK